MTLKLVRLTVEAAELHTLLTLLDEVPGKIGRKLHQKLSGQCEAQLTEAEAFERARAEQHALNERSRIISEYEAEHFIRESQS